VSRYETTFILDPGLDEAKQNEEVERVSQWIKDLGGEIVEVQRWGKRRLAYEIHRKRDGIYTMLLYEGAGELVKELERRMRLNESVLRVLSVLHVPPDVTAASDEDSSDSDSDSDDSDSDNEPRSRSRRSRVTAKAGLGSDDGDD